MREGFTVTCDHCKKFNPNYVEDSQGFKVVKFSFRTLKNKPGIPHFTPVDTLDCCPACWPKIIAIIEAFGHPEKYEGVSVILSES